MNENIENEENVFEIEDYTTQGDMEKFISQIEDTLAKWDLNTLQRYSELEKSELSNCQWESETATLEFAPQISFNLELHRAKLDDDKHEFTLADENISDKVNLPVAMEDLSSRNNDFLPRGHQIGRWYGLRSFIILSLPTPHIIDSEDFMITILSTVQVALFNSNCETPIFVEIKEKYRHMYNGRLIGSGCMTEFQVMHLKRGLYNKHNNVANLSSLIHIFKSKIRTPLELPVQLAIRLSYTLPTMMPKVKSNPIGHFCGLPWGSMLPPINKIFINATWPILTEDLVEDTVEFTDLDPLQAPEWSVQIGFNTESKTSLCRSLRKLTKIWNMGRQQKYYLDQIPNLDAESQVHERALDAIVQSDAEKRFNALAGNIYLDTGVAQASGAFGEMKEEIENVIQSFFSDIDLDKIHNECRSEVESYLDSEMKSSPDGSILKPFIIGLLHQLSKGEHLELRFTYMWALFIKKLRRYYDEAIDIPSVTSPTPQLQYSLFQQKIEMLQYCIRQKQNREKRSLHTSSDGAGVPEVSPGSRGPLPGLEHLQDEQPTESEDEDFFDAEGDSYEDVENIGVDKTSSLFLLKFDTRKINIPVLQPTPPMTEDLLIKREEMMTQLGTGETGKKERLKLQCRVLEFDMMAFKAANNGSTFEDFVRWHSPSDWSSEDGLSGRMTLPGNIWVELWEGAQPVPASRQPRLFDDTAEAESILKDFKNMDLGQIAELIMPVLIHESLRNAIRNVEESQQSEELLKMIPVKLSVESCRHGFSYSTIEQIIEILGQVETFDSRKKWLRTRFAERGESRDIISKFNESVLTRPETVLEGASRGPIAKLLTDDIELRFPQGDQARGFKPPEGVKYNLFGLKSTSREYILRARVGRPTNRSTVLPHRLYALVDDYQFRMAGAFSSDTTFVL